MMANMRYIRLLCANLMRKLSRISHKLVRMVFFLKAQSVHNKRLYPIKIWQLYVADGLHVGDIGELAYTKAENRHLAVHHFYRYYLQIANAQWFVRTDGVQFKTRNARIQMLAEAIRHNLTHMVARLLVAVQINGPNTENGRKSSIPPTWS